MPASTLSDLEQRDDFIRRHIGPSEAQIAAMLETLGLPSLDALIEKTVPENIITGHTLEIGGDKTERGTLSYLRRMSERNKVFISMIGMGYYSCRASSCATCSKTPAGTPPIPPIRRKSAKGGSKP